MPRWFLLQKFFEISIKGNDGKHDGNDDENCNLSILKS